MFARKFGFRSASSLCTITGKSLATHAVGAVPYVAEPLERRVLLSALTEESVAAEDAEAFDASSAIFARLQSHSLTSQDMEALGVAEVQWKGRPVYAKKNQWLVKLNLGGLPSPHIGAGGLINDAGLGLIFRKTLGEEKHALVELPDGLGERHLAQALRSAGLFERVEPNGFIWTMATPNDTSYATQQWAMNNTGQTIGGVIGASDADIDAPEAWDLTTGSTSFVVAVTDTGVDYNHSDLSANMWTNPGETPGNSFDDDGNGVVDDVYGADFAPGGSGVQDGNPMDATGHGTHVAGIIGARGNNSAGVAGVAWTTKIMAVKMLDGNGSFRGGTSGADSAIEAMNYIKTLKTRLTNPVDVRVVNASWGDPSDIDGLEEAIEDLTDLGVLFVAAAGNGTGFDDGDSVGNNTDSVPAYPASYTNNNLISVAATVDAHVLQLGPDQRRPRGSGRQHLQHEALRRLRAAIGHVDGRAARQRRRSFALERLPQLDCCAGQDRSG